MQLNVDVAIIGAGTAGLFALREAKSAGKTFVLIEQGPLGTMCARVGCMPSKALLSAANLWAQRAQLEALGATGLQQQEPDLAAVWRQVRGLRDRFAGAAADGTRTSAGERLIAGRARLIEPNVIEVTAHDGATQIIRATAIVIATGSRPQLSEALAALGDRVVTTDQLFELDQPPPRVGVIGMGPLGLEMGLAMARLGIKVTGVDAGTTLGAIDDPKIAQRAMAHVGAELDLWLGEKVDVTTSGGSLLMRAGARSAEVDLILAASGRTPNLDQLGLETLGAPQDEHGHFNIDPHTGQLGTLPIFVAGDAAADRPLLHEAQDEGAIAGYNAAHAGTPVAFKRRVPLVIAFTHPDIVSAGARFSSLDPANIVIGEASGDDNGRARMMDSLDSLVRIYADKTDGRMLGASLFGIGTEHLGHLIAHAIGRGQTAQEMAQLPVYHPTVEEMLKAALKDVIRQLPANSDEPLGLMRLS